MAELWAVFAVLFSALLGSFSPVFFKRAARSLQWRRHWTLFFDALKNVDLWFGVGFPLLGTVLFIPALRGGDVSVLYPLISTQYVWASFWSVRWLGESMNLLKWVCIALIIGGVTLINLAA